jgi:excinuclease UvrABC ATPase subunit
MSNFKKYYDAHPEYLKEHYKRISAKKQCKECNTMISHANSTQHNHSVKHMYNVNKNKINDLKKFITDKSQEENFKEILKSKLDKDFT